MLGLFENAAENVSKARYQNKNVRSKAKRVRTFFRNIAKHIPPFRREHVYRKALALIASSAASIIANKRDVARIKMIIYVQSNSSRKKAQQVSAQYEGTLAKTIAAVSFTTKNYMLTSFFAHNFSGECYYTILCV